MKGEKSKNIYLLITDKRGYEEDVEITAFECVENAVKMWLKVDKNLRNKEIAKITGCNFTDSKLVYKILANDTIWRIAYEIEKGER